MGRGEQTVQLTVVQLKTDRKHMDRRMLSAIYICSAL